MKTEFMCRPINVMCCGNVDDGKSTFLGRLLYETGNVHSDVMEDMEEASRKYSLRREYSMLLDGLLEERQQQITIDVAYRYLDYEGIRLNIWDCPGHVDFLPGVITSAASADCAILVVDVSKPVSPQAIRHLKYLSLFQIRDVYVVFNKFDKIDYSEPLAKEAWDKFRVLTQEFRINMKPYYLSALEGPADAVCQVLKDIIHSSEPKEEEKVIHVHACILNEGKRVYHGKVLGEKKVIPQKWIVYPGEMEVELSGSISNIGNFSISEDKDIPRGSCLSSAPLCISNQLRGQLIKWGDERSPSLLLRHGTGMSKVLSCSDHHLTIDREIAFSNINETRNNGYGLLIDEKTLMTTGVFVFLANEKKAKARNYGSVIWITGLSGTGKTTLAKKLQNQFSNSILLDADDIRTHINFDLGYSPPELILNVQKIAGMARILAHQGVTVIVSCISKYREQRKEIRQMLPHFFEIHMDTKASDSKGLYASLGDQVISQYEKGKPECTITSFDQINVEQLKARIMKDRFLKEKETHLLSHNL